MDLTLRQRWVIAILWASFALSVAAAVFFGGLILGTFATDSCTSLPDFSAYYLFLCWPIILVVTSLAPSALILRGRTRRTILGAIAIGAIISVLWFLGWIPLLGIVCG